jgi:hypothetical protein
MGPREPHQIPEWNPALRRCIISPEANLGYFPFIVRARFSLLVLLLILPIGGVWARGKLFVYYPSLVRPLAMQEALAEKCPGLDITVFGRQTDFQALVERDHPEAILAQAPVLGQFPDYALQLQGLRKGKVSETYVLLSIDKPVDLSGVSASAIGAVGLLDRKAMAGFVADLLPAAPRINRVTKVEDLLPLLIFRSVPAVLVSESTMQEFQKKSQANLVGVRLEKAKVGLVALGTLAGADEKEMAKALRGLGQGEMLLLGVDAWK